MATDKRKIEVLEGLEPVRLRPGMYIGSTDKRGLHHILWEIIDNSVDEVTNNFGNQVDVTMNADGSITVEDNGRGVPVYFDKEHDMTSVELVYAKLHAGGKFNNENYSYSGGLHGVGASVTNALSRWLKVEICTSGKKYQMNFHSVEEANGHILPGVKDGDLIELGKTKEHGTKVTFLADDRFFGDIAYDEEIIEARLRQMAFLNNSVKFTFRNMKRDGETLEFFYQNGLTDFIDYINCDKSGTKNPPILLEGVRDTFKMKVIFQHIAGYYNETVFSFVNNVETCDGGYHVVGFKSGLARCMGDYAKNNLPAKCKVTVAPEDFREGITAIVSVKVKNPQFEGQTKGKLGNQEVKGLMESIIAEQFAIFAENKKNKKTLDFIVAKAVEAAGAREAEKHAKILSRQRNALGDTNVLVGKYAACSSKNPAINELFIVEGDSAGGSAKQGRNNYFQAVLPIKGKSINVLKQSKASIYGNDEIKSIIAAIGTGTENNFKIENLKFNKIIIMSDADFDGYHIRCLLLSMFYTLTKDLITEGKIFVANPPLYKVTAKNGEKRYAYDDAELEKIKAEVGSNFKLSRFKGLGEMNETELNDTTMAPQKRLLTRVTLDDAVEADKIMNILLGADTASRKSYIYKYANFNVGNPDLK